MEEYAIAMMDATLKSGLRALIERTGRPLTEKEKEFILPLCMSFVEKVNELIDQNGLQVPGAILRNEADVRRFLTPR